MNSSILVGNEEPDGAPSLARPLARGVGILTSGNRGRAALPGPRETPINQRALAPALVSFKLCNHFNSTHDVRVELWQLGGRNPIFAMIRTSYHMHLVLAEKLRSHAKSQHEACES